MNQNATMKVEKDKEQWDGLVGVNSIWYTIQGEGPLSGTPAVFIRLQGCCLHCEWCFVGTTRIATPKGRDKPIADVEAGDLVYSYDQDSRSVQVRPVTRIMSRSVDQVLCIKYGPSRSAQMFVTPEHPVYVVGQGWVRARDVRVGDVLFNLTKSDRMALMNPMYDADVRERSAETSRQLGHHEEFGARTRALWATPEFVEQTRERMREQNPMRDPEVRKRSWTNREHSMTSIEQFVQAVIDDNGLPIRFVGDGQLWVGNHNPDFVVEGQRKVIEVWDSTQSAYLGRDDAYERQRVALYAAEGYECICLAFNPYAFNTGVRGSGVEGAQEWVHQRLVEFIHNGKTVVSVEVINRDTNPKAYARLAGNSSNRIPVYNLEVDGTHTYFANQVLVHNCDTEYTSGKRMEISAVVNETWRLLQINVERVFVNDQFENPLVVVTGGEPFAQLGMPALLEELVRGGFRIQIETSGSAWQPGYMDVLRLARFLHAPQPMIVCSPKTGKVRHELIPNIDAWKYVVRAGETAPDDGLPAVSPETGRSLRLARPNSNPDAISAAPIWVSPCDDKDPDRNKANMAEAVRMAMKYGYRLSLQIHKVIGVD